MSRWVAPKLVGPEGEGTVYILIHQSTFYRDHHPQMARDGIVAVALGPRLNMSLAK